MRVLTHTLLVLLTLGCACFSVAANQPATMSITGKWQSKERYWTVMPDRLRLVTPALEAEHRYIIMNTEPLPAKEWTITFTSVSNNVSFQDIGFLIGDYYSKRFSVDIDPSNDRATVVVATYINNRA